MGTIRTPTRPVVADGPRSAGPDDGLSRVGQHTLPLASGSSTGLETVLSDRLASVLYVPGGESHEPTVAGDGLSSAAIAGSRPDRRGMFQRAADRDRAQTRRDAENARVRLADTRDRLQDLSRAARTASDAVCCAGLASTPLRIKTRLRVISPVSRQFAVDPDILDSAVTKPVEETEYPDRCTLHVIW